MGEEDPDYNEDEENYMEYERANVRRYMPVGNSDYIESQRNIINIFQPIRPPLQPNQPI